MINNRQYKNWSAKFHADHAREPIVMQMELTYRCPLRCVHCYADCYNNSAYAKSELSAAAVKRLMDKLCNAGSLWLTFTGGDPMVRKDFIELYDYAKDKGFIFSVMTSLAALTDEILAKMIEKPPFSIEMTLNGATEKTYEKISQVKGSFKKVLANIDKVLEAGLPLKIKTLISRDNIREIDKIKKLVESRGQEFSPSTLIFGRLNGDIEPCKHRLSIKEAIKLNFPEEECEKSAKNTKKRPEDKIGPQPNRFYRCAIGNWQWHINPRGRLNICSCVREPNYDLSCGDILEGTRILSDYLKNKKFTRVFACRDCKIWYLCHFCPGKAELEVHGQEKIVPYFCKLAHAEAKVLGAHK